MRVCGMKLYIHMVLIYNSPCLHIYSYLIECWCRDRHRNGWRRLSTSMTIRRQNVGKWCPCLLYMKWAIQFKWNWYLGKFDDHLKPQSIFLWIITCSFIYILNAWCICIITDHTTTQWYQWTSWCHHGCRWRWWYTKYSACWWQSSKRLHSILNQP